MASVHKGEIIKLIEDNPYKMTRSDIARILKISTEQVRNVERNNPAISHMIRKEGNILKKKFRNKHELIEPFTPPNAERILIIGDTHEPFTLDEYRDFAYEQFKKYKCTHVVHIGDLVDNHAVSYHESDPEGMSAGDELDAAIENVAKWYKLFPKMDVILGNHDRLIMRKASTGGIPRRWIMDYQDIFGVPGWNFTERVVYHNVQYIHGEGGTARTRAKKDMMNTVQGHLHTQAYIEHIVGASMHVWGMQVGCGVDHRSYAMAYAKDYGKPAIGIGLVLESGTLPINVLMKL
jgi:predicted phosphodiesterase